MRISHLRKIQLNIVEVVLPVVLPAMCYFGDNLRTESLSL